MGFPAVVLASAVLLLVAGCGFVSGQDLGASHDVPNQQHGLGDGAVSYTLQHAGSRCSQGCPAALEPVCGASQQTYANKCLATCQGMMVVSEGTCASEAILHKLGAKPVIEVGGKDNQKPRPAPDAEQHAAPSAGSQKSVPWEHMAQFHSEGFLYAGQVHLITQPFHVGPAVREAPASVRAAASSAATGSAASTAGGLAGGKGQQSSGSPSADTGAEGNKPKRAPRFVRVTRNGHVYVSEGTSTDYGGASGAADAAAGEEEGLLAAATRLSAASGKGHGRLEARPQSLGQAQGTDSGATIQSRTLHQSIADSSLSDAASQSTSALDHQSSAGAGQPWRPHTTGRSLKGVFGADDRVDCPDQPTFPFTAIGQILVRDATGTYVCTGTLVGPDVVLTAAHCVYNRTTKAFYSTLDFAPGRTRATGSAATNTPYGTVTWAHVTMYQEYAVPGVFDPNALDIAVVRLASPIGVTAGWMGLQRPCTGEAQFLAYTAGYPNDMPAGSCKTTECMVDQASCNNDYMYHRCDTAQGQSGSAMWWYTMTPDRRMGPYIRAVHNIEWVINSPSGTASVYINSAVYLTPDHHDAIMSWISSSFPQQAAPQEVQFAAIPTDVNPTSVEPSASASPSTSITTTIVSAGSSSRTQIGNKDMPTGEARLQSAGGVAGQPHGGSQGAAATGPSAADVHA